VTRVLALDTATDIATACVAVDGVVLAEGTLGPERYAAQRILELVDELLAEAGTRLDELDAVVVGTGPGSFTGLRIGIAAARGLGLALQVPVAGVSTLDALRAGAGDEGYAVIDARRGEVFVAAYRHHRCTLEPLAIDPAELAERLAGRREWGRTAMLAVGDGAVRFRAELERAGVAVPADSSRAHRVSALMVCRLGRAREPADRDAVLPDYRREPDAVPPQHT
jgi:tRNA threonylcarbamoyladenosine biosynthesis protein TsaB